MKCAIIETCSDHEVVMSMEAAEAAFGTNRFTKIMKGMDSFFIGWIVPDNIPIGYRDNE